MVQGAVVKDKQELKNQPRNWMLVLVAVIMIILSLTIIVLGLALMPQLGWFAAVPIVGGLSSTGLAVTAIIKNDPAWLLLDLILPG